MAAELVNSKSSSHVRSTSLPSTTHPLNSAVEEQLNRLRSSETASSASSTCQRLGGLKDLYSCVDDWLQLSLTQQALASESERRNIEDLLDGSLRLLDVCGSISDVVSQMKGCIRELESSFRRMRGGSSVVANEVDTFIVARKKMKKDICKSFQALRKMEKEHTQKKQTEEQAPTMLREVEQITISVFESILALLSRPKARSSSWSLVSKLLSSKRVSCDDIADGNEVEALDAELLAHRSGKDSIIRIQNVLNRVEALDSTIWEIEEVLECVFRCLLKARVSLLNILNH